MRTFEELPLDTLDCEECGKEFSPKREGQTNCGRAACNGGVGARKRDYSKPKKVVAAAPPATRCCSHRGADHFCSNRGSVPRAGDRCSIPSCSCAGWIPQANFGSGTRSTKRPR